MMNNLKEITLVMLTIAVAGCLGCGSKKETLETATAVQFAPQQQAMPVVGSGVPKAVVYKIAGNATVANVPVDIAGNGQIISYPAPSDITAQEPLEMTDGYLLDRRGVGKNTVFTKWTYAEYAAMNQAPTTEEIKAAVIAGSGIKDVHVLSMTLSQALADTAAVNKEIREF